MDDPKTTEKSPEWAVRMGLDIAERHIDRNSSEEAWNRWAKLARDIADALYEVATPLKGGKVDVHGR